MLFSVFKCDLRKKLGKTYHSASVFVVFFVTFFATVSCDVKTEEETVETDKLPTKVTYADIEKPYHSGSQLWNSVRQIVVDARGSYSVDDLWAASECRCMSSLKVAKLNESAYAKGVLPEVLVPAVRKEIRENETLSFINREIGPIGSVFAGMAVDDAEVNQEIVSGLRKLVTDVSPGSRFGRNGRIRFDGFTPYADLGLPVGSFDTSDQVVRWNTVFMQNGFFGRNSERLATDPGLSAYMVIKSLAELQYIYGFYAGAQSALTLDINEQTFLATYDPRLESEKVRTIWGKYQITTHGGRNLIQTALNTEEKWTHDGSELYLADQARLWIMMAKLFDRLRPRNRAPINQLFDSQGGYLPDDVYMLGLVSLPVLERLLSSEKLIDIDSREIRNSIDKYGNPVGSASPETVARLMRGLLDWTVQLRDLSDVSLGHTMKDRLSGAEDSFKDGVRLAVQHMIREHISTYDSADVTILPAVDGDLSKAGEVVETFLLINRGLLKSEVLDEMTFEITRSFLSDAITNISISGDEINLADVIWIYRVLDLLSNEELETLGMEWAGEVKEILSQVLN